MFLRHASCFFNGLGALTCAALQFLGLVLDLLVETLKSRQHGSFQVLFRVKVPIHDALRNPSVAANPRNACQETIPEYCSEYFQTMPKLHLHSERNGAPPEGDR